MNIEEFKDVFGNIPFKNIKKIKEYINKNYISKEVIKDIVDECIPKNKNIITGKEEYQPNTNANSYLVQKILELL